ncbi:hypothetical protein KFE25_005128 [Diacronema lutheri]|uniref:UDP-galactose transporter n=2 Tax=Diacronema lutheri TaxID=2081491 RepID=A0A8J5X4W3_DIALT|nr:hypothetical protein KFE25_005128 [Diacronema lutheri]
MLDARRALASEDAFDGGASLALERAVSEDGLDAGDAQPLVEPPHGAGAPRAALPPAVSIAICSVLAAVTALKSLLQAHAVERASGHLAYSTFSLTLIVEGAKLVLSALLAGTLRERSWPSVREQLLYAVPGALYMVDNNFVFAILRYIDAATLAVLWNVKIIFTAVLLRLLLARRLNCRQWIALALLTVGVSVSNWTRLWLALSRGHCAAAAAAAASDAPSAERAGCAAHGAGTDSAAYAAGAVMTLAACAIVSLANVFEEKLLKDRHETPLHCQNVVLYSWGVAFNGCALAARGGARAAAPDGAPRANPFRGLDGWAAAIIVTQALSGILISATFKHVSNVAALYSHAMSMVVIAACTPASANGPFVLGMGIVVLSLVGFYEQEVRAGLARARAQCIEADTPRAAARAAAAAKRGTPFGTASAALSRVTRVTASGPSFVYREVVHSCAAMGSGGGGGGGVRDGGGRGNGGGRNGTIGCADDGERHFSDAPALGNAGRSRPAADGDE